MGGGARLVPVLGALCEESSNLSSPPLSLGFDFTFSSTPPAQQHSTSTTSTTLPPPFSSGAAPELVVSPVAATATACTNASTILSLCINKIIFYPQVAVIRTLDGGTGGSIVTGTCLYSSGTSGSTCPSRLRVHITLSLSKIDACRSWSRSIAFGCSAHTQDDMA